jgi:hypothetical protein
MASRTQRKLKHRKRIYHTDSTGYGRDSKDYVTFPVKDTAPFSATLDGEPVTVTAVPARAECPVCGNREKVRTNGTMSAHGPITHRCAGTGLHWGGDL